MPQKVRMRMAWASAAPAAGAARGAARGAPNRHIASARGTAFRTAQVTRASASNHASLKRYAHAVTLVCRMRKCFVGLSSPAREAHPRVQAFGFMCVLFARGAESRGQLKVGAQRAQAAGRR